MTGIEITIYHVIGGMILTLLSVIGSVWRMTKPIFDSVRKNDKDKSELSHRIDLLEKDVQANSNDHDSLKQIVSHNHKEVMTILRKLEVEFGDMKSTRGANQERLDGFEKRLEFLEKQK